MFKISLFFLLFSLLSCNSGQTVKKVEREPSQQTYTPIPKDFELPKKEVEPVIEEEKSSEPKPDETGVPFDLSKPELKDLKGLYYEFDLVEGDNVFGFNNNGMSEIKLIINSDGKLKNCTAKMYKSDPTNCLDELQLRIVERKNPLKPEQKIKSVIFKVDDIKKQVRFKVFKEFYKGGAEVCYKEPYRCRYHLIMPGDNESTVMNKKTGIFYLSYHFYKNYFTENHVQSSVIPSNQELILPKDELYKELYFTMQGLYLHVRISGWEKEDTTIFEDKEFKKPLFSLSSGSIRPTGTDIECWKSQKGQWKYWDKQNKEAVCPYSFDVVLLDQSTTNSADINYYYRPKEIDENWKYASIEQNGKIFYISLNNCVSKNTCSFVYFPETEYQNDLKRLEAYKKNVDFKQLNDLQQNLLPCLEKKDLTCIKKYIVQPEDLYVADEEECIDSSIQVPAYTFSENDIDELKECIKYENLLIHLLAMKGKNKYCLFAPPEVLKNENDRSTKILAVGNLENIQRSYRSYDYEPPVILPPMTPAELENLTDRLK